MSREEQQVSKAQKNTDGGKYGGVENGRKRKLCVSGLPLTLNEAESFRSKDGVDWVLDKAFNDLKGKQVEEVTRDLPEDATRSSGCHPMCGCGSYQSYGFPAVHPISYNSFDSYGSSSYSAPGYWYDAAGIGCSGYGSYGGASSGYGGPAGAANGNRTVCDAGYGRGSPGPSAYWYGSAGIGCGNGSYGGAISQYGGLAVAPNGNPSVCNDGYGRGPPGAAKNASGYGKNRWGAGCSGYGETLESYENPGAYSAVGGRSAGGEIKHGDRAQLKGPNGEDK